MAAERPVEFLDLDDLVELARRLLGDPPPIREVGLLTAPVARPQTTVGGDDAYLTIWLKAAALFQSVVGNHALVDGDEGSGGSPPPSSSRSTTRASRVRRTTTSTSW